MAIKVGNRQLPSAIGIIGIGRSAKRRHQGKDAGQTPQDGRSSKVAQNSHIDFEESVIMRSCEKFLNEFKIYTKEVRCSVVREVR